MPARRTLVSIALGTTIGAGVAAGPAHAESYFANCMVSSASSLTCQTGLSNWTTAARGVYQDETDTLCAFDDAANGKSGIAVYWPKGKPGSKVRIWAHGGKGDKVCRSLANLPENADYVLQACIGEWAASAANRLITSCGTTRQMIL